MSLFLSRTWADINLDDIEYNYNFIKSKLKKDTKFLAVVKADAYGHGAIHIVPYLEKLGADWFAVSNIEEALQIREIGVEKPILILGFTPPQLAKCLSENNISQAILDLEYAKELSECAKNDNCFVNAHIKVDTGMSRIGFVHHSFDDKKAVNQIQEALENSNLIPQGIFTHFATSDLDNDEDGSKTKKQFDLFTDCIDSLKAIGINFEIRHCANSAATLNNPEYQLDMVRPGIILYGCNPSGYFSKYDLHPAFTLKSVVSMIKIIHKGDTVSYGCTYCAESDMKVATIPVGYADGYSRNLSNKGFVMIKGKKANILGRVCMDQMIVDITGIENIKIGEEVLLFGKDQNSELSVDEFSALYNTINYETLCIIGKRVPRVYYKNEKEVGMQNLVYNPEE